MSAADSESLKLASFWYATGEWAVILGVIIEGFDLFWRRMRKRSARGITEPWFTAENRNDPRWVKIVEDIGWAILVFGLVISLKAHFRISEITSKENARLTVNLDSTIKESAQLKMDLYPRLLRPIPSQQFEGVFDRVKLEIEYIDDPTGEPEALARNIRWVLGDDPATAVHTSVLKYSPRIMEGEPGVTIFVHPPEKDPVPPTNSPRARIDWEERLVNPTKQEVGRAGAALERALINSGIETKIINVTNGPDILLRIGPKFIVDKDSGRIEHPSD